MRRLLIALASIATLIAMTLPAGAAPGDPGFRIAGIVLDELEKPLPGIAVTVTELDDGVDALTVRTGPDGRYSVPVGTGGSFAITAHDPSGTFDDWDEGWRKNGSHHVGLGVRGGDVLDADIQMRRPGAVSGQVLLRGKAPGHVGLRLRDAFTQQDEDVLFTDPDGRFRFDDVLAGRYYVVAEAQSGSYDATFLEVTQDRVAFAVSPGGHVRLPVAELTPANRPRGTVTWNLAHPAEPFFVPVDPFPVAERSQTPGATTLTAGRYVVGMGPQIFRLGTWWGGTSRRNADVITIRAGRTTHLPAATPRMQELSVRAVESSDPTRRVGGLHFTLRRSDSPADIVRTAWAPEEGGETDLGWFPTTDYRLTVRDPFGRFETQTVERWRGHDVVLRRAEGTPVAPLPWDDRGGSLRAPIETRHGLDGADVYAEIYRADDSRRPIVVEGALDDQVETRRLPRRPVKIRFVDPNGRFAPTWYGAGSSFATATPVLPYLNRSKDLAPTTLRENLAPLTAPEVTGTAKRGKTLRTTRAVWAGAPTSFSYRWYRNGRAISKATKSSYKVRSADVKRKLTVKVTAKKKGTAARSAVSRPVVAKK